MTTSILLRIKIAKIEYYIFPCLSREIYAEGRSTRPSAVYYFFRNSSMTGSRPSPLKAEQV